MHALYDLPAPAKLNLFLHVTGRRDDGYHLLQSVFMLIDWCDRLHIERRSDGAISREDLTDSQEQVVAALPADDLTVRAARALQAATGCRWGAHIGLHKAIPTQAGMGGGSSDAATVLLALNRLWNLALSRTQLQAIGLTLGADVPFFLGGQNAWVEGIGDIVRPLEPTCSLPSARFLVVKPSLGLDTKTIFSHPSLKRDTQGATILSFATNCFDFGRNDLQITAQSLCPEVSHALAWLSRKGLCGRMTGSGSAVFARVQHIVDLSGADLAWQIKICDNLTIHPLAGWASD